MQRFAVGKKKVKECKAIFKIKYASGTLTAVAYDASGWEISRRELVSANGKTSIAVKPEVKTAKVGEVVYVPVSIVGENGVVESNADRKLTVTVEGGELLAFGSANPCTEEQYHTGSFTTYHGRALAIVRVKENTTVNATDGSQTVTAVISVK